MKLKQFNQPVLSLLASFLMFFFSIAPLVHADIAPAEGLPPATDEAPLTSLEDEAEETADAPSEPDGQQLSNSVDWSMDSDNALESVSSEQTDAETEAPEIEETPVLLEENNEQGEAPTPLQESEESGNLESAPDDVEEELDDEIEEGKDGTVFVSQPRGPDSPATAEEIRALLTRIRTIEPIMRDIERRLTPPEGGTETRDDDMSRLLTEAFRAVPQFDLQGLAEYEEDINRARNSLRGPTSDFTVLDRFTQRLNANNPPLVLSEITAMNTVLNNMNSVYQLRGLSETTLEGLRTKLALRGAYLRLFYPRRFRPMQPTSASTEENNLSAI